MRLRGPNRIVPPAHAALGVVMEVIALHVQVLLGCSVAYESLTVGGEVVQTKALTIQSRYW